MSDNGNLGLSGTRVRLISGVIGLAAGIALSVALLLADARWWWRSVTVIPFWIGAIGLLQARGST